jgi:hypothetical protein
MFRIALIAAALVAGSAHAQDLDALKVDTRKNALPVLPKVVGMMQETVAAKGRSRRSRCARRKPRAAQGAGRQDRLADAPGQPQDPQPRARHPDVWEARQLADFNIRAANGEKIETLETGEVVTENGKQVYRYIRAIPVGDVCLKCHGPVDKVDASLKSQLANSYPHDAAFGYEKGQIRGALTVKRPL